MSSFEVGFMWAGAVFSALMTIGDIVRKRSDYPMGALITGTFVWLAVIVGGTFNG